MCKIFFLLKTKRLFEMRINDVENNSFDKDVKNDPKKLQKGIVQSNFENKIVFLF